MNHDLGLTLAKLDGDTHTSEASDRREAVRTIQETGHVGVALTEGTQHDGAMRNALVSRNRQAPLQGMLCCMYGFLHQSINPLIVM